MSPAHKTLRLLLGVALIAAAFAAIVQAHLGLGPLHVLLQGAGRHLGLSIGVASIAVNALLLVVALTLREKFGIGSLVSVVLGGVLVDAFIAITPEPEALLPRVLMLVVGTAVMCFGAALYISAQLGAGPYDAVMTGIYRRVPWSLGQVRLVMEVVALIAGWLSGGEVGVGCLIIGAGIGPGIEIGLRLLRAVPEKLDHVYQEELDAHVLVGPANT